MTHYTLSLRPFCTVCFYFSLVFEVKIISEQQLRFLSKGSMEGHTWSNVRNNFKKRYMSIAADHQMVTDAQLAQATATGP